MKETSRGEELGGRAVNGAQLQDAAFLFACRVSFLLLLYQMSANLLVKMPQISDSFGDLKSEASLMELKARCWQGCVPSVGARELISLNLPSSRGCMHSLEKAPSFHLQNAALQALFKSLHLPYLTVTLLCPFL